MKNKNILLKNLIILIVFLISSFNVFSQSKKQQIEEYKTKVDSLFVVLNTKSSKMDSLSIVFKSKEVLIDSLYNVNSLKVIKLDSCQKQLVSLNQLIIEKEAVNKDKNEKLSIANKQLEFKNSKLLDSITKLSMTITTAKINVFENSDFENAYGYNYEFIFVKNEDVGYPDNLNLNGQFTSYYPESYYTDAKKKLIYATGAYKDGFKDGVWKYYLCDGTIQYQGKYIKGNKVGNWTNFDFCNMAFYFTNDNGYLASLYFILYEMIDYYRLDIDINKEVANFNNGMLSDTLYYFNESNSLILKISLRDGNILYDNNQSLLNQKNRFGVPILDLENDTLNVYKKNGKLHYKLVKNGNQITEEYYNDLGLIIEKLKYVNGKVFWYDTNGKLTREIEMNFGEGKHGGECLCQ